MSQCRARILRRRLPFGDGSHYFYLEDRCSYRTDSPGDTYCRACAGKDPLCRAQLSRKYDHGLVDGPIPVASRVYGGEWFAYYSKVYGAPTAEHLRQARAAADSLKRGDDEEDTEEMLGANKKLLRLPPKPREQSKAAVEARKRKLQGELAGAGATAPSVETPESLTRRFVEEPDDDPPIAQEVVEVVFRPFMRGGVKYWREDGGGDGGGGGGGGGGGDGGGAPRLFLREREGCIGEYAGRWNTELRVVEAPEETYPIADSESESDSSSTSSTSSDTSSTSDTEEAPEATAGDD